MTATEHISVLSKMANMHKQIMLFGAHLASKRINLHQLVRNTSNRNKQPFIDLQDQLNPLSKVFFDITHNKRNLLQKAATEKISQVKIRLSKASTCADSAEEHVQVLIGHRDTAKLALTTMLSCMRKTWRG